jgi:hypothetical protein
MSHVFISYARENSDFVERLRQRLIEAEFDVWTDSVLRPGNDWRQEIDEAIRAAFVLLVVVTPEADSSQYVTYEWAYALGLDIKVIPLVLESTSMHPRLQFVQHVDFVGSPDESSAFNRLIDGLTQIREEGRVGTGQLRPVVETQLGTTRMNAPGIWLTIWRGPQPNQTWNLNGEIISLGREITNDIVIHHQEVSRRHARFTRQGKNLMTNFMIEDLGSSNGTFVNKEPVTEPRLLQDGDIIDLGETITLLYRIVLGQ